MCCLRSRVRETVFATILAKVDSGRLLAVTSANAGCSWLDNALGLVPARVAALSPIAQSLSFAMGHRTLAIQYIQENCTV